MPNIKEAIRIDAILGRMKKSVYDQDGDEIVDEAETTVAGGHTHPNADLTQVPGAGIDTNATAHAADLANPHSVSAAQAGAALAAHTHGNADLTGVPGAGIDTDATAHAADLANPHGVTAVQAGADLVGSAAAAQAASEPLGTAAAGDAAHLIAQDHTKLHDQDSDTVLDSGGANEFTAAQGKTLQTKLGGYSVKDEDDMASDSDTDLATQQSVKAYVDGKDYGGSIWQMDMGEAGDDHDWVAGAATDPLTGFVASGANADYDTLQRTGGTGLEFALNNPGADKEAVLSLTLPSSFAGLRTVPAFTLEMEVSIVHMNVNVDNFQIWLRTDDWKDYTILKFEYDGANRKIGHALGRNTVVGGVNWVNAANWNSANSRYGIVRGAQEQQCTGWMGGALYEAADITADSWATDDGTLKLEFTFLTKSGGRLQGTIHNLWIGGLPATFDRK